MNGHSEEKTKVRIGVPLSNKAIYILKPFPDGKKRLPVPSNRRYNANLKGLAELMKICVHVPTEGLSPLLRDKRHQFMLFPEYRKVSKEPTINSK